MIKLVRRSHNVKMGKLVAIVNNVFLTKLVFL